MSVFTTIKQYTHITTLSFVILVGLAPTAHAKVSTENKVKAAIVYNLARFSEWPVKSTQRDPSAFSVCVIAQDAMHEALMALGGKKISKKSIRIVPLPSHKSNASSCNILYISGNNEHNFDLDELAENGILTIGETEAFLPAGGGMTILRSNNTLGFSISRTTMLRANIKPSSRILKLANEVL